MMTVAVLAGSGLAIGGWGGAGLALRWAGRARARGRAASARARRGVERLLIPTAWRRWGAARPRRPDDLLAALDALVAALRGGASLLQAIERAGTGSGAAQAGPTAWAWSQVARRARNGLPLHVALAGWAARAATPEARLVVDGLDLAAATGASPVAALAAVADTVRGRQAQAREVRALSSQARASAAVLVATPLAFAALAAVADHRVAHVLLATPGGWACLLAGSLLDGAGAWWMARLVRAVS